MATDSIMGLFQTPEQYQLAQQQAQMEQARQYAAQDPMQRAVASQYFAGGQLGRALGGEDPALKLQSARAAIMRQVDQTDPQSLAQAAQALNQAGDVQGARALAQAAQEAAFKQSQITKNLREGNAAMLTTDQRNFQQAKAEGYTGSFNQWLNEQGASKAAKTSINVNADQSYGTSFGKGIAENDLALRAVATNAPEALTTIQSTRKLLDSGKVFVGMGANAKLNAAALGQAFGVTGQNENEIIANTQQLQQQRSQAVLNQVKTSGLGTGQGFTDKDLKFLQESAAGSITMSPDTLRRQLDVEERAIRAMSGKWNNRLKTLPEPLKASMGLTGVELPTTSVSPAAQIPTTGGLTGNPLVDKYLVKPQGQ